MGLKHYYKIYGSRVSSEVSLGDLPLARPGVAKFEFKVNPNKKKLNNIKWFHHIKGDDGKRWTSYGVKGKSKVLRLHGECDFIISGQGKKILCVPKQKMNLHHIQAHFLTQAMPVALSLSGQMVMHASAVQINNSGVAFTGQQGQGKSTLSAAFVSEGFGFISDDTIPVKFKSKKAFLTPALPEIRLRPAHVKKILNKSKSVPAFIKQRANVDRNYLKESLPLGAVFYLDTKKPKGKGVEVERLSSQDAFKAILSNCWRFDLKSENSLEDEFANVVRIVEEVPVYALRYPRRLKDLPKVIKKIVHSLT